MNKKIFRKKAMLLIMLLVVCFAAGQANAAEKSEAKKDSKKVTTRKPAVEKTKIQLPDGLYLYDAIVSETEVKAHVGFQKYFVVANNNIYSSKVAIKKFGISRLNKSFIKNKKYKILLGGEKIGEIHNLKIDEEGDHIYKDEYFTKNIKRGPMYGRESIYLGRLGSTVNYIAVPEEYKEKPKKVYKTIPPEEVEKVSKLLKEKLFDLIKNRKEITQNTKNKTDLIVIREELELLDKIFNCNDEIYIGVYRYVISKQGEFEIVFSVKNDNVHAITSQYDDKTLFDGDMKIHGMLDVDGCGEEELIIEKVSSGPDYAIKNLEIYKQKDDGNWILILKNKWREDDLTPKHVPSSN